MVELRLESHAVERREGVGDLLGVSQPGSQGFAFQARSFPELSLQCNSLLDGSCQQQPHCTGQLHLRCNCTASRHSVGCLKRTPWQPACPLLPWASVARERGWPAPGLSLKQSSSASMLFVSFCNLAPRSPCPSKIARLPPSQLNSASPGYPVSAARHSNHRANLNLGRNSR